MILETVESTIEKFKMLNCNDRVIVAVSGGPDSVALLHLLNKVKKKWKLYLHLAHLNHMIRKKEAEGEMVFVKNLAGKLALPVTCRSVNVKDYAAEFGLSLEEAARNLRYDFLIQVAKENFATKIALGHNRDDQAETVLMRLLRGSGISGLCGMPMKRSLENCLIIRPLIEVGRKEIINFLTRKKIPFCTDSSNLKNVHFRNRVRNELFPFLENSFNPNIKEILINLSENLRDDFDFLSGYGQNKFKSLCAKISRTQVHIHSRKLLGLHRALQKIVVRSAIRELKGNVRRINYQHWKELEDLLGKRPNHSIVDLPEGISAMKKKEKLVFYRRDSK